jgi:hypothetical protein
MPSFMAGSAANTIPERGICPPTCLRYLAPGRQYLYINNMVLAFLNRANRNLIMDNVFILNPLATTFDIQAAIHQRLTQLKSIINCLLISNLELGDSSSYGIIWSMDNLLSELDILYGRVLQ